MKANETMQETINGIVERFNNNPASKEVIELDSIKVFETENGCILTGREILDHIESEQDRKDAEDIFNLPVNGEILIDTEWIKRVE